MNRKIFSLAIPNIISNISIPLLGLIDIGIIGHLKSEKYLGAIAIGNIIFQMIFWGFGFLRMGTSGFTAQAYGRKNKYESSVLLSRSLLMGVVLSLILIILQWPIDKLCFLIIDGSDQVKQLARQYYYIRIWSAPAVLALYSFYGWFIGMQNSRFPMIVSIIVNLINIGLNLIFVLVLHLKSNGVALGSVIAQYSGLTVAIILFLRYYPQYAKMWKWQALKDFNAYKSFLHVNKDIFIRTLCVIFVLSFFTSRSAAQNDTILAVNSILWQFLLLFSFFVDGLAYAGEALTGKYIGAVDKVSLQKSVRLLFTWGFIISIPFTLMYIFYGHHLMQLLTNNAKILEASEPYLPWTILIPVITLAAFIWDGVYIGATASVEMRNTMLFSTLIIFIPIYYFTRNSLGNHGLWLAMMLYMLSRGIWLTFLYPKAVLKRI